MIVFPTRWCSAATLWFAATVAICAAALANPCIEFAANAGWFGRGDFTDHSNIDVVPTLLIGFALLAIYIATRIASLLTGRSTRDINVLASGAPLAGVVPVALGIQIGVLYSMETIEQHIAYGHVLGGTLWLGGPVIVSLALHALACVLVAFLLARGLDGFERHAVRIADVIRLLDARRPNVLVRRALSTICFGRPQGPLQCRIGERAPPHPA